MRTLTPMSGLPASLCPPRLLPHQPSGIDPAPRHVAPATNPAGRRSPRTTIAIAAALLGAALLAGCAPLGGLSGQDTEASGTAAATAAPTPTPGTCAGVSSELDAIGQSINSAVEQAQASDFAGAVTTLQGVLTSLNALGEATTDTGLRERIDAVTGGVGELLRLAGEVTSGESDALSSTVAILGQIATVRAAYEELLAYCAQA